MPKPIEPTEAEQRKEALLRAVARAYGATHRAAPRAALIGGTALRIAHGLPRPSSDLDYAHRTSGEDLGKTEIPEILEAMGFKVVATMPDGKIPISDERRNPKGRMAQPARRNDLDQRR